MAWAQLHLVFQPSGGPNSKERVAQHEIITLDRLPTPTPEPTPSPSPTPKLTLREQPSKPAPAAAAAAPARHEIAKEAPTAPPQPPSPPPRKPSTIEQRIAADQRAFSNEVSQLNAQNGAHAIPTIDPGTQGSTMKSYSFTPSIGGERASEGNGIITTTRSWHDRGMDCYYGHYEYTYPNGIEEGASIAWPFCYSQATDPFLRSSHPRIPFPFPLPGFRTDPSDLPPMERDVYEYWIEQGG